MLTYSYLIWWTKATRKQTMETMSSLDIYIGGEGHGGDKNVGV